MTGLRSQGRRTRAIAGPNPFHRAPAPSAAMVFLKQSMIPEYVPVGADCSRDLMTCDNRRRLSVETLGKIVTSKTYIGRDSDGPHRNTSSPTGDDDSTQVQIARSVADRREIFLRSLVRDKVTATSQVRENGALFVTGGLTLRCRVHHELLSLRIRGIYCAGHPPCKDAS